MVFEGWKMYDLTMTLGHDYPAFPIGLQDVRIVRDVRRARYTANADKLEMSCHAGTHLDGPMHFEPVGKTIDRFPLDGKLVGEGVIVDISKQCGDYDFYGEKEIVNSGADVRPGDILFIHTGYWKYAPGLSKEDDIRYFYKHPGPKMEFAKWCKKMKFKYLGIDGGSQDHPLNTGLQGRIPFVDEEFCKRHKVEGVQDIFPRKTWQLMHSELFKHEIIHVENLGGDISKIANKRAIIGTFPLKLISESAPCRVVAWVKG